MRLGQPALALTVVLPLLAACTGEVLPGQSGQNAGGSGGSSSSSGGSAGTGTGTGTATCDDDGVGVAIPKRLVRLSYGQLANGVSAALGETARSAVNATNLVPRQTERKFQPLFVEGTQVSTAVLPKTMQIAKAAADTVNMAPGCAAGDDECTQQFLLSFAQKAYRRSVTPDEQASIVELYAELKGHGLSVEQAVPYAVRGILLAAPALYRTEFGPRGQSGRLTPEEIASQISYFLSDGPPDAALQAAAGDGSLATEAGVRAQIERLLQTQAVRDNLAQVMLAYFQVGNVFADVKDPALYPEYTSGLKNSMYTESDLFVGDVLWNGKVTDLLTSRKAFVNKVIAPIYGVSYPGPATDLEDVFLPVDLPAEQRAGVITRGAMLAMRARPEDTSVVSRGLFINATMLCATQPPEPPSSVLDAVDEQLKDTTLTQRQKSEARTSNQICSGCHSFFDPYGLVLESYDAIGRFRTTYASFPGQPTIDTSTKLPDVAGGATVANVFEFVQAVAENGRFTHCVTANLLRYVLADASLLDSEDCSISRVNEAFRATDQTFSSLIGEVAVAQTVSTRVAQ